jgi:hypothetical protein
MRGKRERIKYIKKWEKSIKKNIEKVEKVSSID